jgi:tetratricopeptide (TPR) repeat protein
MKIFLFAIVLMLTGFSLFGQEEAQKAFSEGVKLLKANKFTEAEKQFSIALDKGTITNGRKMSYIYKGMSLNGQQRYDEAITCFSKAIEIDSTDAASYTDRGLAYSYKSDYTNALTNFQKVLTIDSTGQQAEAAYFYIGKIKCLQHEYKDAVIYLDKLLGLVKTDAEAYFLRAVSKGGLMDSKGAVGDYTEAIKYHPGYMEAYANRGVEKINMIPVELKTGKGKICFKDACADLNKAKSLGDTTVDDFIFLYCNDCK